MCMLHYGVAAGLFKSVSLGGSQRRARQHRSWRTLTSVRVLPSCVSRKQHVVYKTSHVNVVLFTSCFGFVFLISRARNLQLWPCNIFQYQKTLCLISCLCVFKLLSLCVCACVLGWGKGWSLLAGLLDHIPQTGLPPPQLPPPPPLLSDKHDFDLCFIYCLHLLLIWF